MQKWLNKSKWVSYSLPIIVSSLLVSGLTVAARELGVFESFELKTYDKMMQLRGNLPPDSRVLTVLITEDDIQSEGKWPLSDRTLAKALNIIQDAQPHAIGIDLYRDLPVEPGHDELSQFFANSDRLIAVCKLQSENSPAVAAPPSLNPDQVGFADIDIDRDGVVRRSLFYIDPQESKCPTPFSFSLQLTFWYLLAEGIEPQQTETGLLQLGETVLKPIDEDYGGYQNVDANGYQIMLNYRAADKPTEIVTLAQILKGEVNENLIKDKVVLLGVSAPSLKDTFETPFSNQTGDFQLMPGVVIHSQIVSQLLNLAIDGKSLIWSLNQTQETGWIFFWSLLGSITVVFLSRPVVMISLQILGIILIIAISWLLFIQAGWIPLIPSLFSFALTAISLILFNAYQAKQEQLSIQQQVEEQQKSLTALKALLREARQQAESTEMASATGYQKGSILVGRYEIVKALGKGSFGSTYLSRDLQRPGKPFCVVKRLTPASKSPKYLQVVERLFKTEAKILEKVGTHPQIPLLLAYVEENKEFYLIQEYVKGKTIAKELNEGKQYTEPEVLSLIEQLMTILSFIQQYNLIHRDIKPDNIIRRASDNRLVLIDFGAVKQIQNQHVNGDQDKTVIIGNQGYAAPEQLVGQPVMASDIYATGMVAIRCLTGINATKLKKDPATAEVVWDADAHVGKSTARIINKMVRYNFGDRYQQADDVLKDLRKLKRKFRKPRKK